MFNLDLPVGQQYLLYLNDLSPISLHNKKHTESHVYLNEEDYSHSEIVSFSETRTLVIKKPYLRRTYYTREKVSDVLWRFIPETAILAIVALGIAIFLGLLFGILSALYKGTFIDSAALVISTIGMSGPSFFMAVIISWIGTSVWYEQSSVPILPFVFVLIGALLGIVFNKREARKQFVSFSWVFLGVSMFKGFMYGCLAWVLGYALNSAFDQGLIFWVDSYLVLGGTGLNPGTLHTSNDLGDPILRYSAIILPAITLGIRPLAMITQLTRSSMLDVLSQDFIRTARAKGLSRNRVIIKHALINALNPVLTAASGWFASLLAGAVFVETVFNWRGIGLKIYQGIEEKDAPIVIGAVLIIAAFFVIINIVVDILYGIIDPRARIE